MKPLMGQAQSNLSLDDLLSSSKGPIGNFGRSRSSSAPTSSGSSSGAPNFSEVLLTNLESKKTFKEVNPSTKDATSFKQPTGHAPHKVPVDNPRDHRNQFSSQRNTVAPESPTTSKSPEDPAKATSRSESEPLESRHNERATDHTKDPVSRLKTANTDKSHVERSSPQSLDHRGEQPRVAFDKHVIKTEDQMDSLGLEPTTEDLSTNNANSIALTGVGQFAGLVDPSNSMANTLLAKIQPSDQNTTWQMLPVEAITQGQDAPKQVTDSVNLPTDITAELSEKLALLTKSNISVESTESVENFPNSELISSYLLTQTEDSDQEGLVSTLTNPPDPASQAVTGTLQNAALGQWIVGANSNPQSLTSTPSNQDVAALANVNFGIGQVIADNLQATDSTPKTVTPHGSLNIQSQDVTFNNVDNLTAITTENPKVIIPADQTQPNRVRSSELQGNLWQPLKTSANAVSNLDAIKTNTNSAPSQAIIGFTKEDEALDLPISESLDVTSTTSDPFAALSSQIDTSTSTKIEFSGNGLSGRSLEEILIDRTANTPIQSQNKSEGSRDLNTPSTLTPDLSSLTSDATPRAETNSSQIIESSDLTGKGLDSSSGLSLSSIGQDFREGTDGEASRDSRESLADFISSSSDKKASSRASAVSFSNKISEQTSVPSQNSLAQKILGQAEIMFKNGGGSMRMDVEAPGIGKVDVAINLINNQLDVRMITASEQARDMISREVAGLRDGLTQQGISLRGLEVGKAGESSPRHFAGQGGQQFGQGAQDQRATYNDMKEYVQSFRNSYNPRGSERIAPSIPAIGRWNQSVASTGSRLSVRV